MGEYGSLPYKVANMGLADFGRMELDLAEVEMPGLMALREQQGKDKPLKGARIAGSLHMTVQTAALIETLAELGADIRWCSCNIFSTQDSAAAAVAAKGTAAVYAWKGESLEEYWECTLATVTWPEDDGKGNGMDIIVDDGGDMTLLIHEGYEAENAFAKDGSLPDVSKASSAEHAVILKLITRELKRDPMRWHKIVPRIMGVSEETTTGVHRLYHMQKANRLLFPAINVNDCVTKSKLDNNYGCAHSLPDALMRATDVMLAGKRAMVIGYGDVGKGCVKGLAGCGMNVVVTEIDPICALQAVLDGYQVVLAEDYMAEVDVIVTATGNEGVVTYEMASKMKKNSILCNIGHFDSEIEVAKMQAKCEITQLKPQVDIYKFPGGTQIILLAEGRLVNLGCATGHPSFVMSCSFTNQTLAQLELWKERASGKYKRGQVYILPKELDEEVARLHIGKLGAKLTKLSKHQADYINVPVDGPYKPAHYRY
eukprot:CAMPEP_0181309800 /NCGR_PEP_ID=MMETSP1101-20121128/12220_1 /TAXON_ID=46948 /ORGANISM="Rhodomonas abbreviata, Strain Caron Lab Isolate" /LENGTH=483 /DNA_ID=CAMNT_0023416335 /DNA_START=40 /DNA_END=1491 /DNA_ORIENTATION=-